ncbi:MAG: hypothetical protein IPN86_23850 [Saprospiraceae bacterium]|nr:hypothetical protein [Saprospiraceae bacterium]
MTGRGGKVISGEYQEGTTLVNINAGLNVSGVLFYRIDSGTIYRYQKDDHHRIVCNCV